MMKSIYTTVTAVLIASLLTAEAWSPSSPAAVVNRINQNHVIVAPHDVTAAHLTRSTTKLSATTTNKNTSLSRSSRSTLASKLANNLHLNLIRSLLAKLTTFLTHKSKLVMLSTMLTIATLFPQSAVAAKSSLFSLGGGGSTKDSAVISTGSNNGGGGGGVMKVGKFVVTVGAIGAGASTANKVMRNKFTCNDDDDENSAGGDTNGSVVNKTVVSKNEESPNNGTTNGSVVQSPSAQKQPSTEKKKTEEANNKTEEIEPLSEEWIQQQLNDAEKRSNVLNDAIKMTQQSQSSAPVAASKSVTKVTTTKSPTKVNGNSNKNSKKKVSVGNTIGIPPTKTTTTTPTPLVKNLDSKIEMLQRRDAERSIQQQRINDEKTQVEIEKKKVALVEAERKIELAEMEYKKSQQQQQQIVAEEKKEEEATIINSAPITTTTRQSTTTTSSSPPAPAQATTPPIKVGPGGSPAKSKEEDLELTTQVILEYVKTMDSKSSGVADDDSDDE